MSFTDQLPFGLLSMSLRFQYQELYEHGEIRVSYCDIQFFAGLVSISIHSEDI